MRFMRLLLVALLAFAIMAPPRLHAMAFDAGTPKSAAMLDSAAMPDCHGMEHETGTQPGQPRCYALCMAAFACLPVVPVPPVAGILPLKGERLAAPAYRSRHSTIAETPLRPPEQAR